MDLLAISNGRKRNGLSDFLFGKKKPDPTSTLRCLVFWAGR